MAELYDISDSRQVGVLETLQEASEYLLENIDEMDGLVVILVTSTGLELRHTGLNDYELVGVIENASSVCMDWSTEYEEED